MKRTNGKRIALAALLMTAALTACSAKPASSPAPTGGESAGMTYTGSLQEKKDFMIVVGEEGTDGKPGVSYTFDLDGKTKVDAKVGDKVTVTYTGDLKDIDSTLTAIEVTPAS